MEIRRLDWDSQFFGLETYGVNIPPNEKINIDAICRQLQNTGAELAYFFLQEQDPYLQKKLEEEGAVLYDEKITYFKELTKSEDTLAGEVSVYQGDITDELLELGFLAGHESRFKKDPRLNPYFENLYKLWVTNSVNGSIADKVFVYTSGENLAGMASCRIGKDKIGNIGLIAARQDSRGKGIGKGLLQAVDNYYRMNGVSRSTVVTQKSNIQACRFYEKSGFTELKIEYVYHLWFN